MRIKAKFHHRFRRASRQTSQTPNIRQNLPFGKLFRFPHPPYRAFVEKKDQTPIRQDSHRTVEPGFWPNCGPQIGLVFLPAISAEFTSLLTPDLSKNFLHIAGDAVYLYRILFASVNPISTLN
jgi:hypothetical protein